MDDLTAQILDASLPHVAFDGWTDETFKAAIADAGVAPEPPQASATAWKPQAPTRKPCAVAPRSSRCPTTPQRARS